jgi:hypothetical protein
MNDKYSRDLQLKDERRRRKMENKQQMESELETINRLRTEMEAERAMQHEKRRQERDYL